MAFNTREENAADLQHEEEQLNDACERLNGAEDYSEDYEEDDREERSRAGQALQGVCKDCGNGTLNNAFNPAFTLDEDGWRCNKCYSTHLDLL